MASNIGNQNDYNGIICNDNMYNALFFIRPIPFKRLDALVTAGVDVVVLVSCHRIFYL